MEQWRVDEDATQCVLFTLVVLDVVSGLRRRRGVLAHHVVVHERRAAVQGEAAGRAEDTAEDVLRRLLKPVTQRVLEGLVPHQRTCDTRDRRVTNGTRPVLQVTYQRRLAKLVTILNVCNCG